MKNETVSRALLSGALLIVGAVVIWSFTIIGSPAFNRMLSADKNRIEDLRSLTYDVERYFEQEKKLPAKLADLERLKYRYGREDNLEDPTTKKAYEYRVFDEYSYELCSDFEVTSKDAEFEKNRYGYGDEKFWEHGVGRQCFKFEIPNGKR